MFTMISLYKHATNRILSACVVVCALRGGVAYSSSSMLLRASDNHPLISARRTMLNDELKKEVKGIICDMDGTLTDPDAIDFKAMYERNNIKRVPGGDILNLIDQLPPIEREAAMRVIYEEEMFGCDRMKLRPNMHLFLTGAKKKSIPVALSTRNCDHAYQRFLQLSGLSDDYFAPALHRDSLNGINKPDPAVAHHVLQAWEIPHSEAHHVWFIGDSIDDMKCGKDAGCSTCLITTGSNNHVVLQNPELVDLVIEDFAELCAYFKLHLE